MEMDQKTNVCFCLSRSKLILYISFFVLINEANHLHFFELLLNSVIRWILSWLYRVFPELLPLSSQPTSSMRSVQARRQTTGMMRIYWATIGGSKRLVLVLSLSMLPTKTCGTDTQKIGWVNWGKEKGKALPIAFWPCPSTGRPLGRWCRSFRQSCSPPWRPWCTHMCPCDSHPAWWCQSVASSSAY